jgi:hypothetical protein
MRSYLKHLIQALEGGGMTALLLPLPEECVV